jgi:hypothetical protein
MSLRAKLTRVITASSETNGDEIPSDFQIKLVTGSYSDETCALMLTTEGTEYEEIISIASTIISSDELMNAFIRDIPEHDEYGQILMLEYFKELGHCRYAAANGTDYESSRLEKLLSTANEYLSHTAAPCLPSTTDNEHRLIALVQVHPSLTETLADRIGTQSLGTELLDSYYNNPAPSLSNGIL